MGALRTSRNSLKLTQDDSGRASVLGTPIYTLGGDRIKTNDNVFELTPEINKALPSTVVEK